MVTVGEFYKVQNECAVLLESLKVTTEYAHNLLNFVHFRCDNDNEEIIEMQPLYKEHLDNLQSSVRQLSSLSDRLNNKLQQFKSVLDKLD